MEPGIWSKIVEAALLVAVTGGGFGLSVSMIKDHLTATEKRMKEDSGLTEQRLQEKIGMIKDHLTATEKRMKEEVGSTEKCLKEEVGSTEKRLKEEVGKLQQESGAAVKELNEYVADLYEKHHGCRAELPNVFAKVHAVERLEASHDDLERKVSYMQGRQNGSLQ